MPKAAKLSICGRNSKTATTTKQCRNERTSGYSIKQRQYDRDDEENPCGDLQQVRPCEQLRPQFSEQVHWLPLRRHDSPSPIFLRLALHRRRCRVLELEPVPRAAAEHTASPGASTR